MPLTPGVWRVRGWRGPELAFASAPGSAGAGDDPAQLV